jgi:uncharacterized protein DUF2867
MTTPNHPRPRPSARLRRLPAALDGPLPLVRPREGVVAVTGVEKHRRLDLRAEMKLPGEALLSFEIRPAIDGRSELVQTARFKPRGLGGLAYWAAVLPLHGFVFRGMLRGIRRAAEQIQRDRNGNTHSLNRNAPHATEQPTPSTNLETTPEPERKP